MEPRVFISYSRSSQAHQEMVLEWAERLGADGVDVVLDVYDLKEGNDKYAFMERSVNDPSITHVLIISDRDYATKADSRKKGVGTETQIISKEVYDKASQSKFVPIVCEFADPENPFLPAYLKSRIWIDFSTPEAVNHNWERLIRLLYGKPQHEKPALGRPPAYITEESARPSSPALAKLSTLRQALLQGKPGINLYRKEFINACFESADELRIRTVPNVADLPAKILADCGKLLPVRDYLVDWVLLETESRASPEQFPAFLHFALERFSELKYRLEGMNRWNDLWFGAHSHFLFETLLYIVAALLKSGSYSILHDLLTTDYLMPATVRCDQREFRRFDLFYEDSAYLNPVLAEEGHRLNSPAAKLVKNQAQRTDLPFPDLVQADLLIFLMALVTPETRWFPQTLYYSDHAAAYDFFLRCTRRQYFKHLATITGIADGTSLRSAAMEGAKALQVDRWGIFAFRSNWELSLNLKDLDTL